MAVSRVRSPGIVSRSIPNYLRLHTEEVPWTARPEPSFAQRVLSLCQAFQAATGWMLEYAPSPPSAGDSSPLWSAPVNPGEGAAPGYLSLTRIAGPEDGPRACVDVSDAIALAAPLAQLCHDLARTEFALWQREAELAAHVPVTPRRDEEAHLAQRLEGVLRGGAAAVGCQAAALYLLDEGTSALKLRAATGLAHSRLAAPPRPLAGALADLEALLGHAVVLEDVRLLPSWHVPEPFPAAVCVPVSTPSIPLGTLWMFAETTRAFDDTQTGMMELVAGRLAAELEREMLMVAGLQGNRLKRQIEAAARLQDGTPPCGFAQVDGWEVAGWTLTGATIASEFCDWFVTPDQRLIAALGTARERSLAAAMVTASLRALVRAHAEHLPTLQAVWPRINAGLWQSTGGQETAALTCASMAAKSASLSLAVAGRPGLWLVRAKKPQPLSLSGPLLGQEPSLVISPETLNLKRGHCLIVTSEGLGATPNDLGACPAWQDILTDLCHQSPGTAAQFAQQLRERLEAHAPHTAQDDRSVLVIRREDA